ncbi:MAG: DUF2202 domain-containing protein [Tissierellia bacterium]|nr:DUF2202 domain-containing protein [Tissierellia bacterium]
MKKFSKLTAIGLASLMLVGMTTGLSEASESKTPSIQELYDEEHLAYASYKKAAEQFDQKQPFVNIMNSEQRHKQALENLAKKDGQSLSEKEVTVEDFKDYKDAIDKAIHIEEEDIATIERMLEDESLTVQTKRVLERLLKGSQNHLKALKKIAENNYESPLAAGDGSGMQNKNGRKDKNASQGLNPNRGQGKENKQDRPNEDCPNFEGRKMGQPGHQRPARGAMRQDNNSENCRLNTGNK